MIVALRAGRQAGAVKIYVAAVMRSAKKKDSVKLSLPQKLMVFSESQGPLNANVLFCRLFLNLTLLNDQTQGSGVVFSLLLQINSIIVFQETGL